MGIEKIGRYKILEEIGRGGMGVVYKAYDPVIERNVALKMIRFQDFASPSEIEELKIRFRQEVKAAGKLSHPNIVTVYDVTEEEGVFCIVMEYVEGESVDRLLAKKRVINFEDSVRIIIKICEALDYAHKQGIVHRDVKPANIIITKDGVPKLMDFGIAKLADSTVTRTGSALGTPSYTSPEMIKGERVDARTDIFSLGCVFYEMLTGERAFPGENITPIMYKILEEEPTPPIQLNKNLPSAVNSIISKALAKDLSVRYQTVNEFAMDLSTFIAHPEAIPGIKSRERVGLERLLLPLGIGVVGVLIVIFLILFIPQLFRGEVSMVEWVENVLYAKNSLGKEVWRRNFDAEISIAIVCDINSDGKKEVVVGTTSRSSSKGSYGERNGMIYLLDAKGKEIWRVNPYYSYCFCRKSLKCNARAGLQHFSVKKNFDTLFFSFLSLRGARFLSCHCESSPIINGRDEAISRQARNRLRNLICYRSFQGLFRRLVSHKKRWDCFARLRRAQ